MFQGLPKDLIPIYGSTFIDVLGLTILIPLLAEIGDRFHAAPAVVAVLLTVTALAATLSSPFWGRLSDRIGRKPVLLCSQSCSVIGYLLIAVAGDIGIVFVSRVIQGLGGGNLGVLQSYIADVTDEAHREKAFALGAAAFGIGFVVGPIMGGLLVKAGFSIPFFIAAGLEVCNLLMTLLFLKNVRVTARAPIATGGLLAQLRTPVMLNLLGRQFLYIFSFTYFFVVFSLYLERELHENPSVSSFFLALAGGVGAVVQIFVVDRINKRFGELRISQGAFVLSFIAYALMVLINGLGVFTAILVLWAAGGAVLQPTLNKLIADAAPGGERGAVLGFADSLNNAAMIVAPAAGGAILEADPRFIGVLPALCVAAAFVLGVRGGRHGRQRSPTSVPQTP